MRENFEQRPEEEKKEVIFNRVTQHSQEFDENTKKSYASLDRVKETMEKYFSIEEWEIGDCKIKTIGVSHTPETFLFFRKEIEEAINEGDLVINEFTPEASGFYNKNLTEELSKKKSKFNTDYSLEDLRREYLRLEGEGKTLGGVGPFHHEIELLAAKYGKDMACIDTILNQDVESSLEDTSFYSYYANSIEERKIMLKKAGIVGGGIVLSSLGLMALLKGKGEDQKKENTLEKKDSTKITRRKFLGAMIAAVGAATVIAGPEVVKKRDTMKERPTQEEVDVYQALVEYRNVHMAESLEKLIKERGYKKIVFIYGKNHLEPVREYINNPAKREKDSKKYGKEISEKYPDSLRIYRLSEGNNNSEKFVASEEMIWRRIE